MDVLKNILFPAVDEINEIISEGIGLKKSKDTVLFGDGALLDSVGLVNFIIITERIAQEITGKTILLASEKAFSRKQSPFRTIGSLAEYIDEMLAGEC